MENKHNSFQQYLLAESPCAEEVNVIGNHTTGEINVERPDTQAHTFLSYTSHLKFFFMLELFQS